MARYCAHCGNQLTEGEKFCPVCGSPMVLKRDRKKDVTWHLCTNETCKHRVEVENPAAEEAE